MKTLEKIKVSTNKEIEVQKNFQVKSFSDLINLS